MRIPMRVLMLALLLVAADLGAQERPTREPQTRQQRADGVQRDSLEARVRQRMGRMMREQLGLNDEQVQRLQATNRQFEGQRRALLSQERDARMALRQELQRGDSTRQQEVATLLDQMLRLQRQRLDQVEAEQRELATFLTPVQRARLFGMEEQIRRRMDEMRDGRGPGQPGGVRPPPPRRPPPR
jgi:hypothetical protein